jgi:hypothetical protein
MQVAPGGPEQTPITLPLTKTVVPPTASFSMVHPAVLLQAAATFLMGTAGAADAEEMTIPENSKAKIVSFGSSWAFMIVSIRFEAQSS